MKQLLTSAAVGVALAFSVPVWAQQTSPGANAMGMPGPNPGGSGLTPHTTGSGQAPPSYRAPAAVMTPAATPPPSRYEPSAPPSSSNRQQAHTYSKRTAKSADNFANQLNRQELNRLRATNSPRFPPPGYAAPPPPQPYPYPYASPFPYAYPYPPYAYSYPYAPMGTTGGGAPYFWGYPYPQSYPRGPYSPGAPPPSVPSNQAAPASDALQPPDRPIQRQPSPIIRLL